MPALAADFTVLKSSTRCQLHEYECGELSAGIRVGLARALSPHLRPAAPPAWMPPVLNGRRSVDG